MPKHATCRNTWLLFLVFGCAGGRKRLADFFSRRNTPGGAGGSSQGGGSGAGGSHADGGGQLPREAGRWPAQQHVQQAQGQQQGGAVGPSIMRLLINSVLHRWVGNSASPGRSVSCVRARWGLVARSSCLFHASELAHIQLLHQLP